MGLKPEIELMLLERLNREVKKKETPLYLLNLQ